MLFEFVVFEFLCMDVLMMSYLLMCFVCDVCKKDGSEYLLKFVYYLVCGLLRYLMDNKRYDIKFFLDLRFVDFRKIFDGKMKYFLLKGLDIKVK